MEHPLAAMVSVVTLAVFLGGAVVAVINFFVLKSDFVRLEAWHDVGHAQLRADRLKDEVDRLKAHKLVEGKLSPIDQADFDTFTDKYKAAQGQLDKLMDEAQKYSKVK
jgi:hypothetical protein